MKIILFCAFISICGCSSPNDIDHQIPPAKSELTGDLKDCPVYERPNQYVFGSKYIPEYKVWVDWSEDFDSWHYHGRNRDATPEERQIHDLMIKFEETNDDKVADQLRALTIGYKDKIEALEREDVRRLREYIESDLLDNQRNGQPGR